MWRVTLMCVALAVASAMSGCGSGGEEPVEQEHPKITKPEVGEPR